ncbi:pimeloyl-ACP methyl ester carboxylesterase [Neorhizobium galegae]|uniref:alpha/beta hydrolase n=1 Tax=Neorhizobium galegae TaxID=399 RepID=UPI00278A9F84|nr:alpha/beta fold hydrolase [Neorhizobium galegae]MDQ0137759.1 pimeloyl-ACP methyl ester carboxylesterase [Neorhizobium galegae]
MLDQNLEAVPRTDEIIREFSNQRHGAYQPLEQVASAESQAALRQMSIERLMAYGVHHADVVELRGRVWAGESWQDVADELAATCLDPPESHISIETGVTRANRLFRASALVRMSQMMMVENSEERSAIFARAGELYAEAGRLTGDLDRIDFDTPYGTLRGWLCRCRGREPVGRAIVIGGIEGWSMDFGAMGQALAIRGVETVTLDGPGQGESRLVHKHYLKFGWEKSYFSVLDEMESWEPKLPIAFVGNSMGGAVGMHLARLDGRIAAICDNGGTPNPGRDRGNTTFAHKMKAHTGAETLEAAAEVWKSVRPVDLEQPLTCPLLVVHGGLDPLISAEDALAMFNSAVSKDRHIVTFSDGDHCVYNHSDDKHALICDWVISRLEAAR